MENLLISSKYRSKKRLAIVLLLAFLIQTLFISTVSAETTDSNEPVQTDEYEIMSSIRVVNHRVFFGTTYPPSTYRLTRVVGGRGYIGTLSRTRVESQQTPDGTLYYGYYSGTLYYVGE